MNEIIVATIGDLGAKFWLSAFCEACFHWGDLNGEQLPDELELEQLKAKLRCSKCGNRNVLLYRGWDAGGFHVGYGREGP